jgi:hypothetical protein
VRIRAMELLTQLQEKNAAIPKKEAISNVLPLLQDNNKSIRYTAVTTLKELQAKEVIPSIIPLLQDSDHDVRLAAIEAVAKLQAKEAIPTLVLFLKDYEPKIRIGAMNALIELQGKEAIHIIAPLLKDEVIDVRNATKERLSQIQNPLLTALINKTFILLMVICPILAFLPLFLTDKKFFVSIAVFIASIFFFRLFANISPYYPQFKEGATWGGIYQVGVLFVFAISMFLKLIWYIVANVFKRSPDIDEDNINPKLN